MIMRRSEQVQQERLVAPQPPYRVEGVLACIVAGDVDRWALLGFLPECARDDDEDLCVCRRQFSHFLLAQNFGPQQGSGCSTQSVWQILSNSDIYTFAKDTLRSINCNPRREIDPSGPRSH
jgi:hypothetical protein